MRNAGTIGKYNAPGVPGLTGKIQRPAQLADDFNFGGEWLETSESGALTSTQYKINQSINSAPWAGGSCLGSIILEASRSNSEYGASNTVMPASTDVPMGIYLGRTAEV